MKLWHAILIAVTVGALAAVLAGWLMVMPLFWTIMIAVPIAAGVLLATLFLGVAAPIWTSLPTPDESLTAHQASTLSNRFDEAARDQNRFRSRVQPRLYDLALARLRHELHDIESLDDVRARQRLGDELHALLTDRDAQMPSPHRLTELLSRLEGK